MKKNDLVKLAILGLAAGFCISGQVPHKSNQELAMTKCSKSANPASDDDMHGNGHKSNGNGDDSDDQSDDSTSKLEKQKAKAASMKGKSAARKVLEGAGPSDNTTMNLPRKSAAKRSMEAETD